MNRREILLLPLLAAAASVIPASAQHLPHPSVDLSKSYGGVLKYNCAMLTPAQVEIASEACMNSMLDNAKYVLGSGRPVRIVHIPFDRRRFEYGDVLASYGYWAWKYHPDSPNEAGKLIYT